jgi:uroporphyrinogen decarboxylase
MTNRERFRAAMFFEPVDRPCHLEHGFWHETWLRWRDEGLPEGIKSPVLAYMGDRPDLFDYFDVIRYGQVRPEQYLLSPFEHKVLEETESWVMCRDWMGRTVKSSKLGASVPQFLDYPVKDRRDYEAMKDQLAPALDRRYPADFGEIAAAMRAQDEVVVCAHMDGFFGFPRELIGAERLLYMYYDDPGLMREIISDRCDFLMRVYERAIRETKPDFAFVWEDMCFVNGPLIGPATFREFLLPAYQRLTGFLREMGVGPVIVDSDGDVRKLLPLWLEGGVTGCLPFEVKAGMDVVRLGEEFPSLQIVGGINKHALERTRADIDAEIERVLPAMMKRGGYAVSLDHHVQPEIPMENYRYFVEKVREC